MWSQTDCFTISCSLSASSTWHSVTPLRAARAAISAMSPTGTGQEL